MTVKATAADLLDLLIARAPALIAAGITSVSVDGLSATLAKPAPTPVAAAQPAAIAKQHLDPLKDASSYPAGKVPGYTLDKDWIGRPE
jgi:hypothetical protein